MESCITTKVVFGSLFFLLSISNVWAQHDRVPGQYLIKYKKTNPTVLEKTYIQSALGVKTLKHNSLTNSDLVTAETSFNEKYAKDLLAQGIVEYIEPNYIVKTQLTPNDANFSQLWGMNNTGQTGGTAWGKPGGNRCTCMLWLCARATIQRWEKKHSYGHVHPIFSALNYFLSGSSLFQIPRIHTYFPSRFSTTHTYLPVLALPILSVAMLFPISMILSPAGIISSTSNAMVIPLVSLAI